MERAGRDRVEVGRRRAISLGIVEEARIRQAVAVVDDSEAASILRGHLVARHRLWSEDLVETTPANHVTRSTEVFERLRNQAGQQYSSFERHREAT